MFDLSFIELALLALVGLLVLDADDLPKLARMARGWLKKFAELKHEITDTLDTATKELNLKEMLKEVEEEKKKVEEELIEIRKQLPATTSSNDIINLNREAAKKVKIEDE